MINVRGPTRKNEILRLCFRLPIKNEKAIHTAYYFFLGSLGCALGPSNPYCKKILGPIVPGASMKDGVRARSQYFMGT
ncbi:MAG: hypothetical protein AB8Y51_03370 [Coxiella endosymbiont of Haemaphysalis qinghaiensis]